MALFSGTSHHSPFDNRKKTITLFLNNGHDILGNPNLVVLEDGSVKLLSMCDDLIEVHVSRVHVGLATSAEEDITVTW